MLISGTPHTRPALMAACNYLFVHFAYGLTSWYLGTLWFWGPNAAAPPAPGPALLIKDILEKYARSNGLKINFHTSSLILSTCLMWILKTRLDYLLVLLLQCLLHILNFVWGLLNLMSKVRCLLWIELKEGSLALFAWCLIVEELLRLILFWLLLLL
jgi:hypothetical protein